LGIRPVQMEERKSCDAVSSCLVLWLPGRDWHWAVLPGAAKQWKNFYAQSDDAKEMFP